MRKDSIQTNYSLIKVGALLIEFNQYTNSPVQTTFLHPPCQWERAKCTAFSRKPFDNQQCPEANGSPIYLDKYTPPHQLPMDPNSQLDQLVFQASLFSVAMILCCFISGRVFMIHPLDATKEIQHQRLGDSPTEWGWGGFLLLRRQPPKKLKSSAPKQDDMTFAIEKHMEKPSRFYPNLGKQR